MLLKLRLPAKQENSGNDRGHRNLSSIFLRIRDLINLSLADQHCDFYNTASFHARGTFKLEISRRRGLTATKASASLLTEFIRILV
jgi:hypothetical protein